MNIKNIKNVGKFLKCLDEKNGDIWIAKTNIAGIYKSRGPVPGATIVVLHQPIVESTNRSTNRITLDEDPETFIKEYINTP